MYSKEKMITSAAEFYGIAKRFYAHIDTVRNANQGRLKITALDLQRLRCPNVEQTGKARCFSPVFIV